MEMKYYLVFKQIVGCHTCDIIPHKVEEFTSGDKATGVSERENEKKNRPRMLLVWMCWSASSESDTGLMSLVVIIP